jgi:hypothetical protein
VRFAAGCVRVGADVAVALGEAIVGEDDAVLAEGTHPARTIAPMAAMNASPGLTFTI